MRTLVATEAGSPDVPSEDRAVTAPNFVAVLDGATVRTETGCTHGVAWYADHLATTLVKNASLGPTDALAIAIQQTADQHRDTCDLSHPGTPSAAVAAIHITESTLRYLVLGDVTIVLDLEHENAIVTDDRVSKTALAERAIADALPNGSPEKAAALVRMKHAELAARNSPGGYWIAASNPQAAEHAITGHIRLSSVRRFAILTDGVTRIVEPFRVYDWSMVLDVLESAGPARLIGQVREVEASDPRGKRWPRNKPSDDATAVYCDGFPR
ncbi:protein phosphatase 2C domain-containing protein [Micromonospora sp. WMMD987]|uniref:protein phosphatase 2C domain-containing protein n=1 Tax=Micromonospora sp. WMMD987 TaxID=3016089 RepID=UPI00249B3300|nr:protein phosphatase 2C domain-containing protein [Micromonospora sp. WMMD987]WFE94512.1 protein phosphatase 2C domain-containing protein [Micromonospora sp. WMMD987]